MNAPVDAGLPPTAWTTGTSEAHRTGTWRAARPVHLSAPSPCHLACPVDGDVAEWIGRARSGDWRGAWDVLVRHNPFPAVAGRVCHHPCESACNRAAHDQPLSIRALERFAGDAAIDAGWRVAPPARERDGRVAVVGGGPAGLAAAYHLRRLGWRVALHEARGELGGLMRHGIPSYRLPRAVLDAEIDRIVALGVEVRLRSPLHDAQGLAGLRATHDAVFVATGAARPRRLAALDYSDPRVLDGAAWLETLAAGSVPPLGAHVVVVGGGSAAMDAARSARRTGRRVTVLALESLEDLPAQREEVDEALEEGVEIVGGALLRAATDDGAALRLECVRVLASPAAGGAAPVVAPIEGSSFVLRADAIVTSIGQDAELGPYGDVRHSKGGVLGVDTMQACGDGRTWAGGDVATAARYVTEAIGAGARAARAIHAALLGRRGADGDGDADRGGVGTAHAGGIAPDAGDPEAVAEARTRGVDPGPAVPLAAIATWYHPQAPRAGVAARGADERLRDGDEVQRGLDAARAVAEAARCFSCGTCVACDQCVTVCPDLAVRRTDTGYEVLGDWCKGCGLCVRECPSGSMRMVEERR